MGVGNQIKIQFRTNKGPRERCKIKSFPTNHWANVLYQHGDAHTTTPFISMVTKGQEKAPLFHIHFMVNRVCWVTLFIVFPELAEEILPTLGWGSRVSSQENFGPMGSSCFDPITTKDHWPINNLFLYFPSSQNPHRAKYPADLHVQLAASPDQHGLKISAKVVLSLAVGAASRQAVHGRVRHTWADHG